MWRSCRGCSWIHDCHCILLALKYINLKLIEAWICLLLITPTQEKQTRAFIPEMKYFHLRCCNAQPSSSVSLFVLGKTFGKLSSFRSPLLFFLACKLRSKHHFLAFLCRGEGGGGEGKEEISFETISSFVLLFETDGLPRSRRKKTLLN